MNILQSVIKFFKWWWKEQDKLCPHCGYHCSNNSAFCIPPSLDEDGDDIH